MAEGTAGSRRFKHRYHAGGKQERLEALEGSANG